MKTRYWIALFVLIGVLSLCAMALTGGVRDADRVEIRSDGVLVAVLPLSVDTELTVAGHNTVTIRDGKVAVTHADCPDQVCVRRGWCSGGRDIVCLPNRLVIHFPGPQQIDLSVG